MEMPTNGCRDTKTEALAFCWLAFLLTGDLEKSIDIAAEAAVQADDSQAFVPDGMKDGRHLAIKKAIAAMRAELPVSAQRTKDRYSDIWATSLHDRSVVTSITQAELERAVLAIDAFPRVVLLLLVFEGLNITEAAALLGVDSVLLASARAIGLRDLCLNIAATAAVGLTPLEGARACG
jgi:DNA-directed RNA polymerase specialized sigma24 family protein